MNPPSSRLSGHPLALENVIEDPALKPVRILQIRVQQPNPTPAMNLARRDIARALVQAVRSVPSSGMLRAVAPSRTQHAYALRLHYSEKNRAPAQAHRWL